MMQAETFASNLRQKLDKVRQTEAFKTYNSTFQFLSAATNVTFETRSKYSKLEISSRCQAGFGLTNPKIQKFLKI